MVAATPFVEDGVVLGFDCFDRKCCDDGGGFDPCGGAVDCESCSSTYEIVIPDITVDWDESWVAYDGTPVSLIPEHTRTITGGTSPGSGATCLWTYYPPEGVLDDIYIEPSVNYAPLEWHFHYRLSASPLIAYGVILGLFCDYIGTPNPCVTTNHLGNEEVWQLTIDFHAVRYESHSSTFGVNFSSVSRYCAVSTSRDCPLGAFQKYDESFHGTGSIAVDSVTWPAIVTVEI